MKFVHLRAWLLASAMAFSASSALAFSEDDKMLNTPGAAAKFSDPDEQTPSAVNLSGAPVSAGATDPNNIRYDYDPASGTYIPHQK